MNITLLNVSWKAEELLHIALAFVHNLFYLPSLSLKIGLGLGFVPLFVFYPVSGICPWKVLVKDILCQHLVTSTFLFGEMLWGVDPAFPILLQPCASGVTWQGLCLVDLCELVGEGCLCNTKCVFVSNMRSRVCVFACKTDVQGCEFFYFLQGTSCGCIRHRGTATLILLAKYVLEVASSTEANYPRGHYWCFLKIRVSLNFLHAIMLLMAYMDIRLHGSVIFWYKCKSNYFSSSKPVCVSESCIQRNTVHH